MTLSINESTPWQFVSRSMAAWLLPHLDYELVECKGNCSCCGAPPQSWPTPNKATEIVDGYGQTNRVCEHCIPLYLSNAEKMGIESSRQKGTVVIPNKFGMMASVMAVVDQKGCTLYMPEKIAAKMPGDFPVPFVAYESQRSAIQQIVNHDWQYPAVFIGDLGKKKGELIANLEYSYGPKSVIICKAEGVSYWNFEATKQVASMIEEMTPAQVRKIKKIVLESANGKMSPAKAAQEIGADEDIKSVLVKMGRDPEALKNITGIL